MMPNYSYRCARGHVADFVRPVGVVEVECPTCHKPAQRQSVYRQGQWTPPSKLPYKDFAEASDMLATKSEEHEKREGTSNPTPPLWRMAKRYAQRLQAQGATSSKDVRLSR